MATIDDAAVLAALSQLRSEWPTQAWTWDGRMSMVSSAVSGPQIATARAVTERAMTLVFHPANIATAPEAVRAIVERWGGLRGDQFAFSIGDALGLWWPWGGGETVSLRIGFLSEGNLAQPLRALFGIAT